MTEQDGNAEVKYISIPTASVYETMNLGIVMECTYNIGDIPELYEPIDLIMMVHDDPDASDLEQQNAVSLEYIPNGGVRRVFRGVVTDIDVSYKKENWEKKVKLTIESKIRLLRYYTLYKTYTARTIGQVIKMLIERVVENIDVNDRVQQSTSLSIPYIIQAGDNCWDFLQFLLGDKGIRMHVEPGDVWGVEVVTLQNNLSVASEDENKFMLMQKNPDEVGLYELIVLGHGQSAFTGTSSQGYYDFTKGNITARHIETDSMGTGSNSLAREALKKASIGSGSDHVITNFITPANASINALINQFKLRVEREILNFWHAFVLTTVPELTPGRVISLTQSAIQGEPQPAYVDRVGILFLESIRHTLSKSNNSAGQEQAVPLYSNQIKTRDGSLVWRPWIINSYRHYEIFYGRINNGAGSEDGSHVPVDEYGRVPVSLLWDYTTEDIDRPVIYLRLTQNFAGNSYGSKFDPRHGDEVLIQFVSGRPDSAIIVGSAYFQGNNIPPILAGAHGGIVYDVDFEQNTFTGIIFKEAPPEITPDEDEDEDESMEQRQEVAVHEDSHTSGGSYDEEGDLSVFGSTWLTQNTYTPQEDGSTELTSETQQLQWALEEENGYFTGTVTLTDANGQALDSHEFNTANIDGESTFTIDDGYGGVITGVITSDDAGGTLVLTGADGQVIREQSWQTSENDELTGFQSATGDGKVIHQQGTAPESEASPED